MSARVFLRIGSNVDELEQVTDAVEEMGRQEAWPSDLMFQINLVLEELGINIVNHGGMVTEIEVSLSSEVEAITIEISDDGGPFNPINDAAEPDLVSPLEKRQVGGLGLYLVRTMMDELHYRREQGKNYLSLTKRRDG